MSEHDPISDRSTGETPSVDAVAAPSLVDDVKALVDDGKTYLEAELQFQKSRAAFVADRGKSGAAYGIAAAAVLHLALIGLVVGLILALTPFITAWGATALVVGVLVVTGVLLALAAQKRFARLRTAMREEG